MKRQLVQLLAGLALGLGCVIAGGTLLIYDQEHSGFLRRNFGTVVHVNYVSIGDDDGNAQPQPPRARELAVSLVLGACLVVAGAGGLYATRRKKWTDNT